MSFLREEDTLQRCSFLILDCSFTVIEVLCTPCSLIANVGNKQTNKPQNTSVCHYGKLEPEPSDWICWGLLWSTVEVWTLSFLFSIPSINYLSLFPDNLFLPPLLCCLKKKIKCFTFFLCPHVCAISTWFQILLLHLIAGWPWASCWISLRFNLFILKMRIIIVLTLEFCSKD